MSDSDGTVMKTPFTEVMLTSACMEGMKGHGMRMSQRCKLQ